MPQSDRRALFATPVFVFDLDEAAAWNGELASCLLGEQQRTPGVSRSNVGGWHSAPELVQRPEPCFRHLFELLVDRVSTMVATLAADIQQPVPGTLRYRVHGWAMIMRDGNYTTVHDHGDAHWSAVYYVDPGDPEVAGHPDSGLLVLVDPRRSGRPLPGPNLLPSRFLVKPRAGMLVVFPGWLQHYVHSYRGQRPRISISANFVMALDGAGH
jgi:uncharacterized protein (TIGR02466 family)